MPARLVNPNNSDASGHSDSGRQTNAVPSTAATSPISRCYIHNNDQGILSGNSGPGVGQWFSPNPFHQV